MTLEYPVPTTPYSIKVWWDVAVNTGAPLGGVLRALRAMNRDGGSLGGYRGKRGFCTTPELLHIVGINSPEYLSTVKYTVLYLSKVQYLAAYDSLQ